jgi:type IV secretory pathway VirB10-like protein
VPTLFALPTLPTLLNRLIHNYTPATPLEHPCNALVTSLLGPPPDEEEVKREQEERREQDKRAEESRRKIEERMETEKREQEAEEAEKAKKREAQRLMLERLSQMERDTNEKGRVLKKEQEVIAIHTILNNMLVTHTVIPL